MQANNAAAMLTRDTFYVVMSVKVCYSSGQHGRATKIISDPLNTVVAL